MDRRGGRFIGVGSGGTRVRVSLSSVIVIRGYVRVFTSLPFFFFFFPRLCSVFRILGWEFHKERANQAKGFRLFLV
jgi:hypothetical protein